MPAHAQALARAMAVGYRLAAETARGDVTLERAVWELIVEAADTLRRLPGGGDVPSEGRGGWDVIHRFGEIFAVEVEMVGQWARPQLRPAAPSPAAIGRLDVVIGWFAYIGGPTRRRDVKCLYWLAAHVPVRRIQRELNIGRQTVYDAKWRALQTIAGQVQAELEKFGLVQSVHSGQ